MFQKQFHQLLAKLFRHKSQTTLVVLNAIGYAVLGMTHSELEWAGQPAFASRVQRGQAFSPAELLRATEQFYAVSSAWTCAWRDPSPLRVVASFGLALTRIRTAHSAHAFPHTAMSASCAVNAPLADPPGVSGRALGREPLARVCGCMLPGGAGLGALGGAARAQKGQRRTPALRGCLWRMFP